MELLGEEPSEQLLGVGPELEAVPARLGFRDPPELGLDVDRHRATLRRALRRLQARLELPAIEQYLTAMHALPYV